MARSWGIWTKNKLQTLERYLSAFVTASKSSDERIYLDLFAGQPENRDKVTGEPITGSAEIALGLEEPPFTRVRLFELEVNAKQLEASLRGRYPGRDLRIIPGDCNVTIQDALNKLHELRWAPTFAFIDPNGPDCHWATLEGLADFRRDQKTKAEIWMLFPDGFFMRTLPVERGTVQDADAARITAMYGTEDWLEIYQMRLRADLSAAEAREEYVNLMRWRMENLLGYQWTHPLEVKNEQGVPMYHMIFATDHEAGTRIMTHIYGQALAEFPAMLREVRDMRRTREAERQGIMSLFGPEDLPPLSPTKPTSGDAYQHEPPWEPPSSKRAR